MHAFYLRNMYLNNKLTQPGGINLAGVPVDLSLIKTPVFFLSTQLDHIVPWQSAYAGLRLLSGDKTFVLGGSGHIAGVVNPPEKNKYYYYTNSSIHKNPDAFLKGAEKHLGSWWPYWKKWLSAYTGETVPANKLVSEKFPAIEDAPGSYVKKTLIDINKILKVQC